MSWKRNYDNAKKFIVKSIESTNFKQTQSFRLNAIEEYKNLLEYTDITNYLLLDTNPEINKDIFIESYFNIGTIYKTYVESEVELNKNLSSDNFQMFKTAINAFHMIIRVKFEDENALKQIVSIYTQLCFYFRDDHTKCLQFLQEALLFAPENETIHYNLGFIYHNMNKLELALIHYKISIKLCSLYNLSKNQEVKTLMLNNYNGIAGIFRSIKQWPDALYYLLKAEKIDPLVPNIQSQLGVVYTEMRRTDLAEVSYNKAIKNYKKNFNSIDNESFLSEIHLNLGHMHAYNGDNQKSIDSYNKSLQILPTFHLPFQNKLMNLSYLFDQLEDKKYILNQHKLVNKLFKKGNGLYKFDKSFFDTDKINIGIVSGDFVEHPVSYFIGTFLKKFDVAKFNITCYSECIIDTSLYNNNLQFKFIKNLNAEQASKIIHDDKIHILFDLAGHTAFNRLDIFALKPSPIQISYIGYPYSTGLKEMDYRITDDTCDDKLISPTFYTEKLVYLKNCFLCYDPSINKQNKTTDDLLISPPLLEKQPKLKNGYITIGCFNRLNKITDDVIKLYNNILIKHPKVKFVFKTKALLNNSIKKIFLTKFDKSVHARIDIIDCTILHKKHLLEYNKVDISFDTFPYSGTTTSCESLLMGVPVFTLYDSTTFFHAQNVTASILKNSHKDLEYFILSNQEEIYKKLDELEKRDTIYWDSLKETTRNQFINGKVCDKEEYMQNMNNLLTDLYSKKLLELNISK